MRESRSHRIDPVTKSPNHTLNSLYTLQDRCQEMGTPSVISNEERGTLGFVTVLHYYK